MGNAVEDKDLPASNSQVRIDSFKKLSSRGRLSILWAMESISATASSSCLSGSWYSLYRAKSWMANVLICCYISVAL